MKTAKGAASRQQILDAAQSLFIQHGFAGTSVRAIAEHAGGQTVANLYNYFPGKEAILAALIVENDSLAEFTNQLDTLRKSSTDVFTTDLMRIVLPHLKNHSDYLELLMIDLREFNSKYLTVALARFKPVMLQLLDQLASLPDAQSYHAVMTLRLLASLILGYIFTAKFAPERMLGQFSEADWIEQFLNFCSAGMTCLSSANT
ncbi:MAG: TetR/AcrR family transcriptional regulator [Anaerolineae bacterium]|nr:TetR/AcrR family transcriptional regulator [Anaerolineae bacterium]